VRFSFFQVNRPLKPLLGISLKISSALFFTMMSATLKVLMARYPTGEVMFFRSAFALIPLLLWLSWRGDLPRALHTKNPFGHFKRGLFGAASMFFGFAALFYLPLHDAIAIGYASPLIVVILAAIVLKEQIRIYRWSAVAIGFVGVMIMLSPYLSYGSFSAGLDSGPTVGALLCLTGAVLSAGAMIQVRHLTASEQTGAIVFYFTIVSSGLALLSLPFGWNMPTTTDFALFLLAGFFGGVGQILLTECYRWADTSVIAPFEYTTMIWALMFGWIVFSDLPTPAVATGATIVAATGLFIAWREHRLGLMRKRELEAAPQKAAA
jgi:drug/metabolite transporter (DMT)-like permease